MLIEVCGPDGSGKSTLVDGLRARIREAGGVAYERTLRSESRNLMEIVHRSGSGEESFSPREFELAVLLDAVAQSAGELAKYRGTAVTHVFVQQYHCALGARLHRRGLGHRTELRALLDHIPSPDLSLRLAVSGTTCLMRIRNRPKGDGLLARSSPAGELRSLIDALEHAAGSLPYPQLVLDAEAPAADVLENAWQHVSVLAAPETPRAAV